jgi:hypothetical protein
MPSHHERHHQTNFFFDFNDTKKAASQSCGGSCVVVAAPHFIEPEIQDSMHKFPLQFPNSSKFILNLALGPAIVAHWAQLTQTQPCCNKFLACICPFLHALIRVGSRIRNTSERNKQ